MSSLVYINEEGAGQKHSELYHYSQVVRINNIVKISGQGGWDSTGNVKANDLKGQIDLAFANVDKVLQAAGLRGWEDVYLWRSYCTDMEAAMEYLPEKIRSRVPMHKPLWTALSVPKLAIPTMMIEIEVEAYVPAAK